MSQQKPALCGAPFVLPAAVTGRKVTLTCQSAPHSEKFDHWAAHDGKNYFWKPVQYMRVRKSERVSWRGAK